MSTEKDTEREYKKRNIKCWDLSSEKESEGRTERDASSGTERASEDTVDRMKV